MALLNFGSHNEYTPVLSNSTYIDFENFLCQMKIITFEKMIFSIENLLLFTALVVRSVYYFYWLLVRESLNTNNSL